MTVSISERLVSLDGVGNFRDLGHYPAADGKTVKPGVLFRSATLFNSSDADLHTIINQIGIKHIVDLRKQRELDLEPHPQTLLDAVTYHWLPINLDGTAREDIDRRLSEGTAAEAFEGLLMDVNRAMVRDHAADMQRWFDILLSEEGPILFHCSEGKDRTGFTAALFLSALGVDFELIMQDYLLTNTVHKKSIEERVKNSKVLAAFDVDAKSLERLLAVDEDYLNAAFDQIHQDYGSVEQYLNEALSIDKAAIEQLKAKYLV